MVVVRVISKILLTVSDMSSVAILAIRNCEMVVSQRILLYRYVPSECGALSEELAWGRDHCREIWMPFTRKSQAGKITPLGGGS